MVKTPYLVFWWQIQCCGASSVYVSEESVILLVNNTLFISSVKSLLWIVKKPVVSCIYIIVSCLDFWDWKDSEWTITHRLCLTCLRALRSALLSSSFRKTRNAGSGTWLSHWITMHRTNAHTVYLLSTDRCFAYSSWQYLYCSLFYSDVKKYLYPLPNFLYFCLFVKFKCFR